MTNCLDSSFVVDFLDPEQDCHPAAEEWMERHRNEPLATVPVCAFEVLRGAARTGDAHFDRTRAFLRTLEVPTFGLSDAVEAGDFDGRLHAGGTPLSARDTLVASQARDHGYTLVTRDRDFEGVPGLDATFYA